MSGYGAGYADVISSRSLSKLCPKEYKIFKGLLKKTHVDHYQLEEFINDDRDLNLLSHYTDDEKASKLQGEIVDAWANLQSAFYKITKSLELTLGYHDSEDNGSSYDEVNDLYFSVVGMYQLSPAGKKFKKIVNRKFFVTFG